MKCFSRARSRVAPGMYICIVLAFNSFIFLTHITHVKVTRDHVRDKIAHESRNGFTIYKNQLHKKPNKISRPHMLYFAFFEPEKQKRYKCSGQKMQRIYKEREYFYDSQEKSAFANK